MTRNPSSDATLLGPGFAHLSPSLVAELAHFRVQYSPQSITVDGQPISYHDTGQGAETVLLFHGASQTAEFAFRRIMQLRDRFRVIAPTINRFRSLDQLSRGLGSLLDQKGIDRVHVMGGSFGGMIGQAFFHRNFHRANSLLLSFTLPPLPEYALLFRAVSWLLRAMPSALVKRLARRKLLTLLDAKTPVPEDVRERLEFCRAHFMEMISSVMTKSDLINQYRLTVEFNIGERYRAAAYSGFGGTVFIAASKDDSSYRYHERLKAQYSTVEEVVYQGGGHVGALVHEEDYLKRVMSVLCGA